MLKNLLIICAMIRFKTPKSRYAAAENRAQNQRDAGIPDRRDDDNRIALPFVFGLPCGKVNRWTARGRIGYIKYRVTDDETGAFIGCWTLKGIGREIVKRMPVVQSIRTATR